MELKAPPLQLALPKLQAPVLTPLEPIFSDWFPITQPPWESGAYEARLDDGKPFWRKIHLGYSATFGDSIEYLRLAGITHWRGLTERGYRETL